MAETFLSLKGQLLLDSGQLSGSFFHRTVVLICQHDGEGAFGLILNRPTDNTVSDALVADLRAGRLDQEALCRRGDGTGTGLHRRARRRGRLRDRR